jgi:hypothetical protein
MKALPIAKETYIRMNNEGMMSIQHQVGSVSVSSSDDSLSLSSQLKETSRGQTFIDFLLLSIEEGIGRGEMYED